MEAAKNSPGLGVTQWCVQSVLAGVPKGVTSLEKIRQFLKTAVYILMWHLCPLLFGSEKSEMHPSKACKNTH